MTQPDRSARTIRKGCVACHNEFEGDIKNCPYDGTVLTELKSDDLIGTVFAERFDIVDKLGGGGMGAVYKAKQKLINRTVAIKVLHKDLMRSTDALKRFQVEATASSSLSSPNILTIFDFGVSDDGQPYMVMDYLHGRSLNQELESTQRIAAERAIKIFIQICKGLSHAHSKGIVHRDIKPSNIMLIDCEGNPDFVKIVDFGIAKSLNPSDSGGENLTRTGEVFGSPLYMSPEQCRGKKLDTRTDIYSMGSVMYKTLTGCNLFETGDSFDTLYKQVMEMPTAPNAACPEAKLPEALEAIVMKALAKDPAERFQTMDELKLALEQCAQGASQARTTTPQSVLANLSSQVAAVAAPITAPQAVPDTVPPPPADKTKTTKAVPIAAEVPAVPQASRKGQDQTISIVIPKRAGAIAAAILLLALAAGGGLWYFNQPKPTATLDQTESKSTPAVKPVIPDKPMPLSAPVPKPILGDLKKAPPPAVAKKHQTKKPVQTDTAYTYRRPHAASIDPPKTEFSDTSSYSAVRTAPPPAPAPSYVPGTGSSSSSYSSESYTASTSSYTPPQSSTYRPGNGRGRALGKLKHAFRNLVNEVTNELP